MCIRDSYSKEWVKQNILHQTEDEIGQMQKQMDLEKEQSPEEGEEEDNF